MRHTSEASNEDVILITRRRLIITTTTRKNWYGSYLYNCLAKTKLTKSNTFRFVYLPGSRYLFMFSRVAKENDEFCLCSSMREKCSFGDIYRCELP